MKKILFFLLPFITYNSANAQYLGDVNNDGQVTIADVFAVVNVILSNNQTPHADYAVDLGLPSGIKWASCNLGATSQGQYGGYYAWGETSTKSSYTSSTYKSTYSGSYICGSGYDAATKTWGGDWRMPTSEEFEELLANCTKTWTTVSGKRGYRLTGPNGKSIFLPCAGHKDDEFGTGTNAGSEGYYLTGIGEETPVPGGGIRQCAYCYRFDKSSFTENYTSGNVPYEGMSIRPVLPDNSSAKAIDLGLPSGTKWASYNVGANNPEQAGGYYAWGEIEQKDEYSKDTYLHKHYVEGDDWFDEESGMYFYGEGDWKLEWLGNIGGTNYDVAHMKWGRNWRMPTVDDYRELINKCEWSYVNKGGVKGYNYIGPNGNSIFIPITYYKNGSELIKDEYAGTGYWTDSQWDDEFALSFDSDKDFGPLGENGYRWYGYTVRPVESLTGKCDVNKDGETTLSDLQAIIDIILNTGDMYKPGEPVDLGLPSGMRWASCNVGASNPWEYGGYYAWGETQEKYTYIKDDYIFCDGSELFTSDMGQNIKIHGTNYDVASQKWGGSWRMPSNADFQELLENCTQRWIVMNGIRGVRLIGPNGNSIFLPLAGYKDDSEKDYHQGLEGRYASGDGYGWVYYTNFRVVDIGPRCLTIKDENIGFDDYSYYPGEYGVSVRPVMPAPAPAQAIDLGLPSGTKWASCNVGAKKAEEYGGYYSWAEIEEKEKYNNEDYLYYQDPEIDITEWYLPNDISGTPYDVAFMKWGAPWQMPTHAQIEELVKNCSYKWTTLNGVNGIKLTGPNGNTIFMPAAGYRRNDNLTYANSRGFYSSSTQDPSYPKDAKKLDFTSGYVVESVMPRFYGFSVRPVSR